MIKWLTLVAALAATPVHAESLRSSPLEVYLRSNSYSAEDYICLAQNIYFEARNQSHAGKLGVAMVVLNRVADYRYPNDVCGVVKQAKYDSAGRIIRNRCQFSWYCDGLSDSHRDEDAWWNANDIADEAILLYNAMIDITDGSTHYHARTVHPRWADELTYVTTLDDHHFYRWD
jgi:N-acetylmuramoyl-L-alanine amidase